MSSCFEFYNFAIDDSIIPKTANPFPITIDFDSIFELAKGAGSGIFFHIAFWSAICDFVDRKEKTSEL